VRRKEAPRDQIQAPPPHSDFSSDQTHAAAHFTGFITDDFSSEFDPSKPHSREGSPWSLAGGHQGYNGVEISLITPTSLARSTAGCTRRVRSTAHYHRVLANLMIFCMNDPGPMLDPRPACTRRRSGRLSATAGRRSPIHTTTRTTATFCYEWVLDAGRYLLPGHARWCPPRRAPTFTRLIAPTRRDPAVRKSMRTHRDLGERNRCPQLTCLPPWAISWWQTMQYSGARGKHRSLLTRRRSRAITGSDHCRHVDRRRVALTGVSWS